MPGPVDDLRPSAVEDPKCEKRDRVGERRAVGKRAAEGGLGEKLYVPFTGSGAQLAVTRLPTVPVGQSSRPAR